MFHSRFSQSKEEHFSSGFSRPSNFSDNGLREFDHLLSTMTSGKESIRKSSNWAVDHNQYDPGQIIRMIYDHVMQANAYNQKIIFLYLYDDILSTSSHHEAAYDFAKDLKRSMEPTLSTLFSDIYHSTSEKKEQSLLFDILNHWRKKHYFEDYLISDLLDGLNSYSVQRKPIQLDTLTGGQIADAFAYKNQNQLSSLTMDAFLYSKPQSISTDDLNEIYYSQMDEIDELLDSHH